MAKLQSTLPNMLLSLTIICVVAGALLGGVNRLTAEPIALAKAAALETAIKKVTPEFDNSPTQDAYTAELSDGTSLLIYPARKNGKDVGVAVESYTMNGFSGEIRLIVGFDTDGRILNYSILQHSETPGLGSKMDEWFKTDKNKQNILGRSLANGNLKVSKDGGDVDAITASTITSRAFLEAINRAYSAYAETDALTGATWVDGDTSATATNGKTGATQVEQIVIEEGGQL